jgi:outer membrane protein assembly factor BamE (lipoprotein component of BamABCDE complex)
MCAVLLPAAAALSGCAGKKYGNVLDPQEVATIIRGKTTQAEVANRFGDPDKLVDLGGGKQEVSYIREEVNNHGNWFHSNNVAFWLVYKNNVVEAFGERATSDEPDRSWSPSKRSWVWW